jgi:PAS domain S-box-containing protein
MYNASILLVEDNKVVVLELRVMVESMGYIVADTASSGHEAIIKAELLKPDLIIMDIRLKGDIDGIETSTAIREKIDVPIVYLTAHADENTLQRAKLTEPFGYIIKPFDEREVKTTVEMALYKHSMDKKLKESEKRFRLTFELDSIGNCLTAVNGRFADVNDTLCNMLGFSRDELLSRDFISITHPDDIEISKKNFHQLLSREKDCSSLEKRFIKKNGSIIWINLITTLLRDTKEQPVHFISHFIDITDRKLGEEALKESEQKYRDLVEGSPDAIAIYIDGKVVYANNACVTLSRASSVDQLIGMSVIDFVHPDYLDFVSHRMDQLSEFSNPSSLAEEKLLRLDGTGILVEVKAIPIKYNQKEAVQIIIRDITERKLAEEALRQSEDRYRQLYENSSMGIYRTTPGGEILMANPALLKMLHYSSFEELAQRNLEKDGFEPSYNRKSFINQIETNGEIKGLEAKWTCKDGTVVYVRENAHLFCDSKGKPLYYDGTVENITEHILAEEQNTRNEHLFKLFFEHSPASIAMFDREMNYIITSTRFLKDYDLSSQNVIGRSHYEIFPEIPERWKIIHRRCLNGETIKSDEDTFLRTNGKLDWISWEICPWYQPNHEIGGIILFSEVISERKYMQEALQKSEERYRSLFKNAPVGVFYSTSSGKIISVNDEYARIMGYDSPDELKEIVNLPTIEEKIYIRYDDLPNILKKAVSTPGTWMKSEQHFRSKDGKHLIANLRIRALPENVDQLEGFLEDVTERRLAEETLRQSEERYRRLVDNAPTAVAVASLATGRLLYLNNNALDLMGPIPQGKNIHDYSVLDFYANPNQRAEIMRILIKEGHIANIEIQLKNLDNRQITTLASSLITTFKNEPAIFISFYDITDRKLAYEMLAISEVRYRSLFESAKDGILILDFGTGIIVDVNPFFTELFGYSHEKLIGKEIWEVRLFKDIISDKGKFLLLQEKEYVHYEELSLRRADNRQVIVEFVSNVYSANQHKVIQCNVRDITERKRMEIELRESEERFRMVFENMFDGISIYDENPDPYKRKLIDCNERYAEMAGRSREELLKLGNTMELQVTLDNSANRNRLESLSSGTAFQGTFSWIRPDGKANVIEYSSRPIKWQEKTYSIGIDRDITDKAEIEKELKKYRENLEILVEEKTEQLTKQNIFFRTLIDTIPNPIYVKDTNLRYTEVNKAFEECFGIKRVNVLGKKNFDILGIEGSKFANNYDEQLLTEYNSVIYQSFSNVKGKGTVPVLIYKSSFGLPGKKPEGISAMMIDITEQKEMEKNTLEALKKEKLLNELKTNFISTVSHEFRTPLTTILSSADLLANYHRRWEEAKIMGHYSKIQNAVHYMISMLDEVLIISRSDRGKIEFNPSTMNLRDFSADIIEQVKIQALPHHNIIYDYRITYQEIIADSKLLDHILINLLTNSVKFSPSGGDITLLIEDENEFIKFTIKDNGIGIPHEDIHNLFEPFFRAQNATGIKGTGLGLSIVKNYVELHKGEISLESDLGKGTKFFVRIKKENSNS